MYQKRFEDWSLIKQSLEKKESEVAHVRVGEIRWASLGVNIGSEIYGKGNSFSRPCLILHVVGGKRAIVLPLTSKSKTDDGYVTFEFGGHMSTLCINQVRSISQKRIFRRIGKIPTDRLEMIRKEVGSWFKAEAVYFV